jgi:hypothetical protein
MPLCTEGTRRGGRKTVGVAASRIFQRRGDNKRVTRWTRMAGRDDVRPLDDFARPQYELLDATNVDHLIEAALSRWCAIFARAASPRSSFDAPLSLQAIKSRNLWPPADASPYLIPARVACGATTAAQYVLPLQLGHVYFSAKTSRRWHIDHLQPSVRQPLPAGWASLAKEGGRQDAARESRETPNQWPGRHQLLLLAL